MGGSMGVAVGEGLVAAARLAVLQKASLIAIPASGGARMQEGILSLMQMPRSIIATQMVKEAGLPYIVLLTDPTTGGVSASFAMLGDIQIAEPGAQIGFAGARVIEETIRETLPEGFQRAEYLLAHGMVDMVVPRKDLRTTLIRIFDLLRRPGTESGCRAAEGNHLSAALVEALETLKRFHPKLMDLSLGRVKRLLGELGHPERKLPPVIHVAGTNGKGSTVAFMRAILEAAGYRVHAYTSPHLVEFNERIRLAGRLIEDPELLDLIEEVRGINNDQPITFFEITTAIAFLAFSRVLADAVLLETGLGGIMDATNVVDCPAATTITRISYDHMQLLGTSIDAIAGEKAGIIKPGVPIVLSRQKDEAVIEVVSRRAEREAAPLILFNRDWKIERTNSGLHYQDQFGSLSLPLPALLGPHQYDNAGAAIATLRNAGKFSLAEKEFAGGLRTVEWPGRLQRLSHGPLVELLSEGSELWLDGGHNDSGGEALGEQASIWKDKQLGLIFGMLNTKDTGAFLRPLAPYVKDVRTIAIPEEELSLTAEAAAAAARNCGLAASPAPTIREALRDMLATGTPRILICGSLYLAGYILRENG